MNNESLGLSTLLYALECLEPGACSEARFALLVLEKGILSSHPHLFADPDGLRELLNAGRMDLLTGDIESARLKIRMACSSVSSQGEPMTLQC